MTDASSRAVFLSYASQDSEPARRICEALRAAGIEVWFDQSELRGGDAWDSSIRRQIKTCALFMPRIADDKWLMLNGESMSEYSLGHEKESRGALDELQRTYAGTAAYQIAQVHAWRGEKDLAFNWLDRAYSQRDAGLTLLLGDPLMDSLRGDARFTAVLHKLQLPQ